MPPLPAVHYLPSGFGDRAACGRYLVNTKTHTTDPQAVTCIACARHAQLPERTT